MYDRVMTPADIEAALKKYVHNKAVRVISAAPKPLIEAMGGVEKIVQVTIRDAVKAAEALAVSPRIRLSRTVAYWLRPMNQPDSANWNAEDIQAAAEMDEILRVRLVEIRDALQSNDVDTAFQLFRSIQKEREGEKHPAFVVVPESLDPSSAYWVDLDLDLDN